MWTPTLVLIAAATLTACALLGGGVYETVVIDPAWPKRPGIIQQRNGGISRRRFWIPAHTLFEVLVVLALVAGWDDVGARVALLVALGGHAVMRVWSLVDFVPKAVEFERTDPAEVDQSAAEAWARRSLLRLPLDLIACVAMLTALVAAAA